MTIRKLAMVATVGALMVAAPATAQDADSDALAQANNPLADAASLSLQTLYTGNLTGIDESANSVLLRGAQPFQMFGSTVITRFTLPINTFPDRTLDHETGVGDLNLFAAYLIDVGNPAISFGIGPQITAPTAAEDALGSGKWSGGIVNVLFNASSPIFQYGYLLTWQASFAGDDDRADVNVANFQPFLFYQLGGGTYLRSTGVMTYDFERDAYAVPIGLGIGQLIPTQRGVLNIFIEPQYSVATRGDGMSEWGVFAGLNFQW
jgi:hypothetical protein